MKTYEVSGTYDLDLAYEFETELELTLVNEGMDITDWTEDTAVLKGEKTVSGLDFTVEVDAADEASARAQTLELLESGWVLEEGVELVEVRLTTIEIEDITEEVDEQE